MGGVWIPWRWMSCWIRRGDTNIGNTSTVVRCGERNWKCYNRPQSDGSTTTRFNNGNNITFQRMDVKFISDDFRGFTSFRMSTIYLLLFTKLHTEWWTAAKVQWWYYSQLWWYQQGMCWLWYSTCDVAYLWSVVFRQNGSGVWFRTCTFLHGRILHRWTVKRSDSIPSSASTTQLSRWNDNYNRRSSRFNSTFPVVDWQSRSKIDQTCTYQSGTGELLFKCVYQCIRIIDWKNWRIYQLSSIQVDNGQLRTRRKPP